MVSLCSLGIHSFLSLTLNFQLICLTLDSIILIRFTLFSYAQTAEQIQRKITYPFGSLFCRFMDSYVSQPLRGSGIICVCSLSCFLQWPDYMFMFCLCSLSHMHLQSLKNIYQMPTVLVNRKVIKARFFPLHY